MPPASPVNREEVKVLAIAVGIREAARRMGISEELVMKWSQRGKWLTALPRNIPLPPTVIQRPLSAPCPQSPQMVISAGDAMSATLADLGQRSKFAHAKAGAKAAEHLAEMDGEQVLALAQQRKAIIDGDKVIHGWQEKQDTPGLVSINFIRLELPDQKPVVDV